MTSNSQFIFILITFNFDSLAVECRLQRLKYIISFFAALSKSLARDLSQILTLP